MRCGTSTNRKLLINLNHERAPECTAILKATASFYKKQIPLLLEVRILLYLAKREFFNLIET